MFSNHADVLIPEKQDFIWCAEYLDGTNLCEFNIDSSPNEFIQIDKSKLLRFGLISKYSKLYYEVFSGIFKIAGQMIQLTYVDGDNHYDLMGQPQMYTDLISYKNADFIFNHLVVGSGINIITQYNFGYKEKFTINNINFCFQAICQVPMNEKARFEFRIVSDQDLNGYLEIKRNNRTIDKIDAPLRKMVGGEITWEIR